MLEFLGSAYVHFKSETYSKVNLMIFLDPTSDIAFKKLFGDQAKKEILISFLNSVLERKEGEKIVNVTVTNPQNTVDTIDQKTTIVDVRCIDQCNKNYIVEMQVAPQRDYPARATYYASLGIARQLAPKDVYRMITPVIFVGITRFKLFESPEYLSHHTILNTKTHEHALRHLEFHFIELPKFTKSIDQLDSVVDKWIYLLQNAATLMKIPPQLSNPIELSNAMDTLIEAKLLPEELDYYHRILDARRVSESVLETALEMGLEQGMAQGMAQGMEKGMAQGIEKGIAQGMEKVTTKMIINMLNAGMDIKTITQIAGVDEITVKKIKGAK